MPTANSWFHVVVTSCCPSEPAAAVVASATELRLAVLAAWVMPTTPGVTEARLARELPPATLIDAVERDRDSAGRDKDADHAELGGPAEELRKDDPPEVDSRLPENLRANL